MSRKEEAKAYFLQGYNCTQAIVMCFKDVIGEDQIEIACKAALPFGGGVSRQRLTCGAASGLAMVAGLVFGKAEVDKENKKEVYLITQELFSRFKEKHGCINCGEILSNAGVNASVGGEAEERTKEYYKKRPCLEIVGEAAEILEIFLVEKGIL